ncbi:Aminomethyltransferase folate-binding domain-containing isoform B [Micractinium conductrix]|uniref:Aminomethyltransferase folate-binding domain-containing isoform B n=1 Tax=Micractinium conductrix TaxID=554055 RepID=A0A2P6V8Z6_9CHLO|nr:Aminomethyltransferase folate-binding domain-containing isoform B [Micractinium conductrix]|eukprot:PSC70551.1 Aminomethyltransferase folate-binding domain-containing isoform B [Micractinium conductrix]
MHQACCTRPVVAAAPLARPQGALCCTRAAQHGRVVCKLNAPLRQQEPRWGAARAARRRLPRPPAAAAELPDLDALLEAGVPEIGGDLADVQAQQNAVFDDAGVVVHFRNDSRAMHALEHAAVVVDRSHWGRLRLAGEGRLAFLHGQSTANLTALSPGQGCDTVFVTPQGRCIDLATVYAQGSGALVLVSPGMATAVRQRLEKHLFPADKVQVSDVGPRTCMFSLLGPQADAVLRQLQAGDVAGAAYGSHTLLSFAGKPVIVAVGGGLPGTGYTLIADESVGADLWRIMTAQEGVEPMGTACWEMARVMAGRPAVGSELTDDYTALDAGLYGAVSLQKGCYVGQETLAKVHNLDAVRQQLWGLEMEAPCVVGDPVLAADGRQLGAITSYIDTPSGQHRALAYLKCRVEGRQVDLEGTAVSAGGSRGRVVLPPFLSRGFPAGEQEAAAPAAAPAPAAQDDAEAAARRAQKLAEMQARLAAYQATAQQQQQQQQGTE